MLYSITGTMTKLELPERRSRFDGLELLVTIGVFGNSHYQNLVEDTDLYSLFCEC
jgi:hypothetical protein